MICRYFLSNFRYLPRDKDISDICLEAIYLQVSPIRILGLEKKQQIQGSREKTKKTKKQKKTQKPKKTKKPKKQKKTIIQRSWVWGWSRARVLKYCFFFVFLGFFGFFLDPWIFSLEFLSLGICTCVFLLVFRSFCNLFFYSNFLLAIAVVGFFEVKIK